MGGGLPHAHGCIKRGPLSGGDITAHPLPTCDITAHPAAPAAETAPLLQDLVLREGEQRAGQPAERRVGGAGGPASGRAVPPLAAGASAAAAGVTQAHVAGAHATRQCEAGLSEEPPSALLLRLREPGFAIRVYGPGILTCARLG